MVFKAQLNSKHEFKQRVGLLLECLTIVTFVSLVVQTKTLYGQGRDFPITRAILSLIEHGNLADAKFTQEILPFDLGPEHRIGERDSNSLYQSFYQVAGSLSNKPSLSVTYVVYHPGDQRYDGINILGQITFNNLSYQECISLDSILRHLPQGTTLSNAGLAVNSESVKISVVGGRVINILVPAHIALDRCMNTISLMETKAQ